MFKNGLKIAIVLLIVVNVLKIDVLEPNLGTAIFVGIFCTVGAVLLNSKNSRG